MTTFAALKAGQVARKGRAPGRAHARTEARWVSLLETGPHWRGGYGRIQDDANEEYATALVDAAHALQPACARTEGALLLLVHDLVSIVNLPIDDSSGLLAEIVYDVTEALTPVFAETSGSLSTLAEAMADACTAPYAAEYLTYSPSDDIELIPFGALTQALGADYAAEFLAHLEQLDTGADEDFLDVIAGLAEAG